MKSRLRESYLDIRIISYFLIIAAPFLHFLISNGYSIYHSESIIDFILLLVVSSLLFVFVKLIRQKWLDVIIISFLLTFTLNLLFSWETVLLPPITIGVVWIFRQHIHKLIVVVFAVLSLAIILIPSEIATVNFVKQLPVHTAKTNPNILHIILDEHIGIDGIPSSESGKEFRKSLTSFYRNHNFNIYRKAYSTYSNTYNTIPNLLNFQDKGISDYYFNDAQKIRQLKQNYYFDLLDHNNYKIRVYQSDYMNFCQDSFENIEYCNTYISNTIKTIEDIDISVKQKAVFIMNSFLYNSDIFRLTKLGYREIVQPSLKKYGLHLPLWEWEGKGSGPIEPSKIIKKLEKDLIKYPSDRVFFVHLLTPHNPYVYDSDCNIKSSIYDWKNKTHSISFLNTETDRASRYNLYFLQAQCLLQQLDLLFTTLKEHDEFQDLQIIMHGDHGSRIHSKGNTIDDQIANHSTLFVTKESNESSISDSQQMSINQLFYEFLNRVLPIRPEIKIESSNKIFVKDPNGKLKLTEVPYF